MVGGGGEGCLLLFTSSLLPNVDFVLAAKIEIFLNSPPKILAPSAGAVQLDINSIFFPFDPRDSCYMQESFKVGQPAFQLAPKRQNIALQLQQLQLKVVVLISARFSRDKCHPGRALRARRTVLTSKSIFDMDS